jgi:hypothetical protein
MLTVAPDSQFRAPPSWFVVTLAVLQVNLVLLKLVVAPFCTAMAPPGALPPAVLPSNTQELNVVVPPV